MSRFSIPRVRNVDSGLDVGFALVNTGTSAATINATLRSATGTALATKSLTLGAGAHTSTFARDFFALTAESAGTNYSYMAFESSSAQFAATALAIEGGSLSSFPVSAPGATGTGAATELAEGSVTTAKIANGAVTSAKLALDAVVSDNIAAGAVTTAKLADGGVTGAKLAAGTITNEKVATGQIVKSINSLKDDVTLAAGSNITITPSGNTLTIASTAASSGTTVVTGTGSSSLILSLAVRTCLTGAPCVLPSNTQELIGADANVSSALPMLMTYTLSVWSTSSGGKVACYPTVDGVRAGAGDWPSGGNADAFDVWDLPSSKQTTLTSSRIYPGVTPGTHHFGLACNGSGTQLNWRQINSDPGLASFYVLQIP
jgi:hypothetical protein